MKHSLTFLLLMVSPFLLAQMRIGDKPTSTTILNANSLLELESTTRALLLPRLSQFQIDAMQGVPAGMLVYNSTTNLLNIRSNTSWVTLAQAANAASATNPFSTSGSVINTSASRVGIGTSNPYSQLANTSDNTVDSQGNGGGSKSLSWAADQVGYVGQFFNNNFSSTGNGLLIKVNNSTATALEVAKNAQNSVAVSLLTVKATGRVGIGTNDPQATLDVKGAINATDLDVQGTINATNFNIGIQYLYRDSDISGNTLFSRSLGCPSGYKPIGGGGGHRDYNAAAADIELAYSGPDPDSEDKWRILVENNGFSTRAIRIYVICGKVL